MLGRNPKDIEKMMKKLNINTNEIDAEAVIIKKRDGDMIIDSPHIMVMNMMGRDVYQITGNVRQKKTNEDDVKLVMEQTGKDRSTVEKTLEDLDNDLARTIAELKRKD